MTGAAAELVRDLQQQVRAIEEDLRAQVERLAEIDERLRADYADARQRGRTAETWSSWLDAQATQAAVSWVLGCVFVRFCEDNDLTDKRWIAGTGDGLTRAVDAQAAWIQANPRDNERGWLREAFTWLRSTRAGASLFPETDFVWWWDISADAASQVVAVFRRRGSDGELILRFDSSDWDTRFLGDLYQDLSETARKRYALLQTPEFVEEFILDLTLTPALEEFGVEELRMIDPACGSGHFLLGAFRRLLDAWVAHAPAMNARTLVQRALDGVHGVDVNAGATAIAKFRLAVAALRASGARRLDGADSPAFELHIATGDSLLRGVAQRSLTFEQGDPLVTHAYSWEDIEAHPDILAPGRYHVVVGNPPYITVKDKALNSAYRQHYETCSGKYPLFVPFAELFFRLAQGGQRLPGFVGQITSNAFMKREFGKRLIENFFAGLDLTYVIDTSGAYIPGHGTPTVILIGRSQRPRASTLRAVLGVAGEPTAPADPAAGRVWTSIVENIDRPGQDSEFVSVVDLPRSRLETYPWSLSGGGASELLAVIEASTTRLREVCDGGIGPLAITGDDDVFVAALPRYVWKPDGATVLPFTTGTDVRDWSGSSTFCLWPYYENGRPNRDLQTRPSIWPFRARLRAGLIFGETREERGLAWNEFAMVMWSRLSAPRKLVFAAVATHAHFFLCRDPRVLNRHAPVISLPEDFDEHRICSLLAVLNSSTACFWLKQVSHGKGNGGVNEGYRGEDWEEFYEFTGTKLLDFPLPASATKYGIQLDELAVHLQDSSPDVVAHRSTPTHAAMAGASSEHERTRRRMIALQEELDWDVYRLFGILEEDLTLHGSDPPPLELGERAFELALARKMHRGEIDTQWFNRHGSSPIMEIPTQWPSEYRDLVRRRIDTIESHPLLHLIERPECKRRWAFEAWAQMTRDAWRDWLLDRLGSAEVWQDERGPRALSVGQLSDVVRTDSEFRQVLDLYLGRPDYEFALELGRLLKDGCVPYLAAHRYKPSGMRKRTEWERAWTDQRDEDRSGAPLAIPASPKYAPADFQSTSFWRARGKLDVPKERFIAYPGAERQGDATAVLGWAGWNDLERAQAIARLILDRLSNDGWSGDRLAELLAGLLELEPWLHQWHREPDAQYGGSPADFYTAFLDEQAQAAGLSRDQLRPLAAMPNS